MEDRSIHPPWEINGHKIIPNPDDKTEAYRYKCEKCEKYATFKRYFEQSSGCEEA